MKISTNFLLLLLPCILFSCKQNNASTDLLRQAQNIVEDKPNEALALLDSIQNTEDMDADSYMQHIVTRIHAKYKTKQEILGDTLVFEAQEYFDGSKNSEQAALANYYAGIINRKMNRYDKSLISFLKAGVNATKTGDNKLSGRISDYIGAVYFEQGAMDSAALNYRKALHCYSLEKDSISMMRATNQIGRCYEDLGKLDSAYVYFNNALQIAKNINGEKYKNNITQNLGVITYKMGEYDKAIEYYQSVLDMKITDDNQRHRAYLSLLKIYNLKQDKNLAKEFALKVEASLPDVTDIKTKKEMYAALTNYYKLTGDYKQALNYSELKNETILQIAKEEQPAEMIKADTNFRIEQKDRFYGELQSDFYLYLTVGIVVLLTLVVFISLALRQRKKDKEEFRLEAEKYERARRYLEASNKDYARIEAEIKEMLEDTEDTENK
ncbi:tetratricopeptide repeat protein [Dysgonomonas alginatilytica]|uniref:Tetratricopeptide repeat protein n=1 Tax=Dysgonomonas alginatilytica TaxID=1605892 RepID=A0A2V3PVT2_9BACT|nr:tetratricopeptide repeat protein [Dysgonomonas alginatilytica]PXV69016.1 tetratricopeptide repeat protein [Dysgonomonas alginatilytica]